MIDKQALIIRRGGHCEYEGCKETRGLELHHAIVSRSKKKRELLNVEENYQVLCPRHHRGIGHSYEDRRTFWRKQVERGYDMRAWYDGLKLKSPENFD